MSLLELHNLGIRSSTSYSTFVTPIWEVQPTHLGCDHRESPEPKGWYRLVRSAAVSQSCVLICLALPFPTLFYQYHLDWDWTDPNIPGDRHPGASVPQSQSWMSWDSGDIWSFCELDLRNCQGVAWKISRGSKRRRVEWFISLTLDNA